MLTLVPEAIERYAAEHAEELPELYERLRRETYADIDCPQMQVGRIEGRLLKLLARLIGARRVVEIGTFTGYSALSIAEGMAADGELITLDRDPKATAVARRYFAQAPWGGRIRLVEGPALRSLEAIEGPLDMAFIDADKGAYIAYWEALVPKMRPGGLLVVDNVLWSGKVLAPEEASDHAIVAFNRHVAADERVEQVMLTVRDGMTLAVRR